ncbi:hypothetical protein ACSDR0_46090 [Streptosporangium sp. G11]|uniref:hypothetical protein n=1 Tax=Streptosporangium sp. G11 TaxID=3436926 RepID=UPI003EB76C62
MGQGLVRGVGGQARIRQPPTGHSSIATGQVSRVLALDDIAEAIIAHTTPA